MQEDEQAEGVSQAHDSLPDAASGAIKINIASPSYDHCFSSAFVVSLVNLLNSWRDTGVGYHFSLIDTPDIELSRNFLLTRFYYKLQDCSHILFLDDDMGFDASLINRMIGLNESVVGVVAPMRYMDLKKLHAEAAQPFEQAVAKSAEFLLHHAQDPQNKPGFIQVNRCGSGILLISRDCVTRMLQCCPELADADVKKHPPLAHQFDTFLTPFDKTHTATKRASEDYAFCDRWVNQCGGRIYANVDSRIQHIGTMEVDTRYEDLFETGA